MGICSFTQHLLIEHRLCVRTGAIKWVHNSEKPNQQKSRYGSALMELLVYRGRQILITSSLTPVRGPGALRGVWTVRRVTRVCLEGVKSGPQLPVTPGSSVYMNSRVTGVFSLCGCPGSCIADPYTKRSRETPGKSPEWEAVLGDTVQAV